MKLKKKSLCCDQEWAVEAALGRSRGPWRPSSDSRRRRLWNKGYDNNQHMLTSICVHRCGTVKVRPGLSACGCVCPCMVHFHGLMMSAVSLNAADVLLWWNWRFVGLNLISEVSAYKFKKNFWRIFFLHKIFMPLIPSQEEHHRSN